MCTDMHVHTCTYIILCYYADEMMVYNTYVHTYVHTLYCATTLMKRCYICTYMCTYCATTLMIGIATLPLKLFSLHNISV